MIIFENIDTGETVGIDRETGGKFYRSQLTAIVNSSNMGINADRGQDFGWRLEPKQQALIEEWEQDPDMIDKVSTWAKVQVDALTHGEFLSYLLYQQELGKSPERGQESERRAKQVEYEARVAALRTGKPEAVPAFDPKVVRGEATIDDFLDGKLDNTVVENDNFKPYAEESAKSEKVAAIGVDVTPAPKTTTVSKPKAKK